MKKIEIYGWGTKLYFKITVYDTGNAVITYYTEIL